MQVSAPFLSVLGHWNHLECEARRVWGKEVVWCQPTKLRRLGAAPWGNLGVSCEDLHTVTHRLRDPWPVFCSQWLLQGDEGRCKD